MMYNQHTSSVLCQLETFHEEFTSTNNSSDRGSGDGFVLLKVVYSKPYIIVMRNEGEHCHRTLFGDLLIGFVSLFVCPSVRHTSFTNL